MKLSHLFKKEKTANVKTQTQTLDKKQLEKLVGGAESTTTVDTTSERKSGSVVAADYDRPMS